MMVRFAESCAYDCDGRRLSWVEAKEVSTCYLRRNPNSFYSGTRVFPRFTRRRLNQNQGLLSVSQVLRVLTLLYTFLALVNHIPETCTYKKGTIYKWLRIFYNIRCWRYRILKYQKVQKTALQSGHSSKCLCNSMLMIYIFFSFIVRHVFFNKVHMFAVPFPYFKWKLSMHVMFIDVDPNYNVCYEICPV